MKAPNEFKTAKILKSRKDAPLIVFITTSGAYTV